MHLSLAEFKVLVRDQFFVLQLEHERAVEALATLVPEADARKELLKQVHAIVGAGDPPNAAERDRLARLSQVLAVPIEKRGAAISGRPSAPRRPPGRTRWCTEAEPAAADGVAVIEFREGNVIRECRYD